MTSIARFDGKLSLEQKKLFEKAASLGGFRSLTDFIFLSAQQKADEIIKNHEFRLDTERDREVFFNALINPPEPNDRLKKAFERYGRLCHTE